MLRLLAIGRPYRGQLLAASLLMLLTTGVSLSLPVLAQAAVNGIPKQGAAILDKVGLLAAGLLLISGIVTYFQFLLVADAGNRIITDTRENLFAKLQRLPISFFDVSRSGDLTSTLSNDVSLLQSSLTDDLVKLGGNVLQLVGGLVLAVIIDFRLTLVVFGLLCVTMAYFVVFGIRLRKLTRASLDALSKSMGAMTEALANIRLVKAFARESHEDLRAHDGLGEVLALNLRANRSEGLMVAVASAGSALMLTGVVWYGGTAVLSHALTVGALLAFLIDVAIISAPMAQLAGLWTRLQRAIGAADRIFALMDEPEEPADGPDALSFPHGNGAVSFRHLRFSYSEDVTVLKNLSLELPPGKVTAIVGASGAGKSTLASLLYRFYEPQGGDIEIDGVLIRDIRRRDLRENIGLVPQDTVLFNGSIRDNIRYGRLDATEDEVIAAAEAANLWEYIAKLPDGLDTLVGERGVTLSGGQRQRVAIARVLLKNPKIIVLDEATSALDSVSEALVKEALDRLMAGRTTMVIAHRLTTVQNADQIAVIDDGKVLEIGVHSELIKLGGLYADLCQALDKAEHSTKATTEEAPSSAAVAGPDASKSQEANGDSGTGEKQVQSEPESPRPDAALTGE